MILAPIVRRKADDEDEREETSRNIAGFRAAYVFDISQTDGKELPQIGVSSKVILAPTTTSCAALRRGRASPSSIPRTSHPPAERPTAAASPFFQASLRPRSFRRSPMSWRTSFFAVATVGRQRANASAKPKRKPRRSLSATALVSQPVRRLPTTSSCGTEMSRF